MSKDKSPILVLSVFLTLLTGVVLLEGGCIFWLYREVATLKSQMETRVPVISIREVVDTALKKNEHFDRTKDLSIGSSKAKRQSKGSCTCVDGVPGTNGSKGEPGRRGEKGEIGLKGQKGAIGPVGRDGRDGVTGNPGVPGPPGPPGSRGDAGRDGRDGIQGTAGVPGVPGAHGLPGEKGDNGKTGSIGMAGPKGSHGDRGVSGSVGPKGDRGTSGPKGQKGETGQEGMSGGVSYIRWGRLECPNNATKAYSGIAFGLEKFIPSVQSYGGSDWECLPYYDYVKENYINFSVNVNNSDFNPITYFNEDTSSLTDPSFSKDLYNLGLVPCVLCHQEKKSDIHTFPSFSDCPNGWSREYSGTMMSGMGAGAGLHISEAHCIDKYYEEVPRDNIDSYYFIPIRNIPFNLAITDEEGAEVYHTTTPGIMDCSVCSK